MEEKLFKNGFKKILAIDEVGRGSLAGPFFVGGLLLTYDNYSKLKKLNITDSKKINSTKRNKIFQEIKKLKIKYKIKKFSNKTIDKLGLGECFYIGILDLFNFFKPHIALVDGKEIKRIKKAIKKIKFIIKGDEKLISIGAVSIIVKVLRDNYMIKLHRKIPFYNFRENKGYGTYFHLQKIKERGISIYHRKSFLKNI